ncbi:FAD/NAD(P)-binding protein [Actinomycetaceae bacterium L2_0104]
MTEEFLESFDVVIVGGGPRAVALVQRLTARLAQRSAPGTVIGDSSGTAESPHPDKPLMRIAVVDAVEVGPGATWRTDQTSQFLNNTPVCETTIYPDESTPIDGPLGGGPTLVEWIDEVTQRDHHEPPWVIDEARELTPDSFSTRRLQGVYYGEQLARAEAAGFVCVDRFIGIAEQIEYDDAVVREDDAPAHACRTVLLADGRRLRGRTVVLAQGMVQSRPDPSVQAFSAGAERLRLRYIEPGMPTERPWHEIPENEDCIIRGLGANFFDVVAELTAGRGGRFIPVPGDPSGRLRYLPSGHEPRLHAVSRRGVPYRGKGVAGPSGKPRYGAPVFATPQWFDSLERSGRLLRFGRDVWPTIAAEFAHAFGAALAARDPGALPAGIEKFNQALIEVILESGGDGIDATAAANTRADATSPVTQIDAVNNRIDTVLAAHIDRPEGHSDAFRLDLLMRPTRGLPVSEEEWHALIAELIEAELDSIAHPLESPRQAVNLAMAAVRGRVAQLVAKGLIEGESLVTEVQGWFESNSIFLASGPPGGRVRQVIALIEAGIVSFVGPQSTVAIDEGKRCFVAHSPLTGISVEACTFAEARMSKGDVTHTDDPLIRALLEAGRARIHRLPLGDVGHQAAAAGERTVATQSIEAVPPTSAAAPLGLVAADGTVDPHVMVLGIPASSTQPGSAIGAAPRVPSPLLTGADIAARTIIDFSVVRDSSAQPALNSRTGDAECGPHVRSALGLHAS